MARYVRRPLASRRNRRHHGDGVSENLFRRDDGSWVARVRVTDLSGKQRRMEFRAPRRGDVLAKRDRYLANLELARQSAAHLSGYDVHFLVVLADTLLDLPRQPNPQREDEKLVVLTDEFACKAARALNQIAEQAGRIADAR